MPIDPIILAQIKAIRQPIVCGYWAVTWDINDPTQTRYYSDAAYHQMVPFGGIGHVIEAQVLNNIVRDVSFEINPDLRTDTITIPFNDIPVAGVRPMSSKFQQFKSGVRCELFFYFPEAGFTYSAWFGQLRAPQDYAQKSLNAIATNGTRSREQLIPSRMRQKECNGGQNFGGQLPTLEAVRTNGCRWDRHLGGTLGSLNGGALFKDCPGGEADCNARFGTTNARYYLGFKFDASAVATDGRSGYLAVSRGNESALKQPIRVIFGNKHVRALQLLLWRQEVNANTPAHGFVRGVWEISEGPNKDILNFQVKDKIIEQSNLDIRFGTIAQLPSNYAGDVSNYSLLSHVSAAYGYVDAITVGVNDIPAECDVVGYADVLCFNTIAAGAGLVGKYYADGTTTTEVARRVVTQVNFPSSSQPPVSGQRLEIGFLIVLTGFITFPATETVTLKTTSNLENDDFMQVDVNGGTVFSATYPGTGSGTFAATAGIPYPITVTIRNNGAAPGAFNPWGAVLRWQSASIGAAAVVPASAFTHSADAGFVRQWTDDRLWCLLELYMNQRFGMQNPSSRFNLTDFQTVSLERRSTVSFTKTFADGETQVFSGIASTFNVILEGRPVADQIGDIILSGGITFPFQNEGKYTIRSFRPATATELANAKIFTDTGQTKNIEWASGQPAITLTQIPDDILVNEITMAFEEGINKDAERPITVDDPNQKLKAGRILGENNLQTVPKQYSGLGIRELQEAVRIAYRILKYGESDGGGVDNNLKATFTVPFVQALGVIRYDVIKIVSTLLNTVPQIGLPAAGANPSTLETPQYFRVLKMTKLGNGLVQIEAQAYNRTSYEAFEVVSVVPDPTQPPIGTPTVPPPPVPQPCLPAIAGATYDATNKKFLIPITC